MAVPAACCVALVLALLASAPAFALPQRGHVFKFSFGEGQLSAPSGIAVNDSNGHVYVTDHGVIEVEGKKVAGRVSEFEPVTEGGEPKEKLLKRISVPNAEAIAIDNAAGSPSQGDVYVSGARKSGLTEDRNVYKFKSDGTPITTISKFKPTEHKKEEPPGGNFKETILGLAVDASGDLFVYSNEGLVFEFNSAEVNVGRFKFESAFLAPTRGLAVDAEGKLYVGHGSSNVQTTEGAQPVIGKFEVIEEPHEREVEPLIEELNREKSTAVAVNTANEPGNLVNELNDIYITSARTIGGETVTTVAAFSPTGAPIQRFGVEGAEHMSESSGLAVEPKSGDVFVTDAHTNKVYVFTLEPPGPPKIDSLSSCFFESKSSTSCAKNAGSVKLNALVDPSGIDTHAYFEYGTESCATPGSCTKTFPEGNETGDLGGGFGDQAISVELAGLKPGAYHYRVVAANGGEPVALEQTFDIAESAATLPDGRAWEMVSWPVKDGAEPEAIAREGGDIQSSPDGSAITYVSDGPIPAEGKPEGSRSLEYTQVLSRRGTQEWESQDISTAHSSGTGVSPGTQEYQQFSTQLSVALVEPFPGNGLAGPFAEPPLSPPVFAKEQKRLEEEESKEHETGERVPREYAEKTVYLRDNAPLSPQPNSEEESNYNAAKANGKSMNNAGFLPLVSDANAPGATNFGGGQEAGVEFITGTPDLSHVLIESWRASPGLYEWGPSPTLQPVSLIEEGGTPTQIGKEAVVGALTNVRHAISNDGSRVIWSRLLNNEHFNLYVRETKAQKTLQLDTVQEGASGAGEPQAVFQAASADGSKIFFTDTQRLTKDSHAIQKQGGPRRPDLYVSELQPGGAPTLTDLTPEGINGEPGFVVDEASPPHFGGGVLGASEDGSYVYFVTNAALAEGDAAGDCTRLGEGSAAGRQCNLYLRHFTGKEWQPATHIATLSNEDEATWGGEAQAPGDLGFVTSRVSPSGLFLAFMSREAKALTGYNNQDATCIKPATSAIEEECKKGGRIDEEVFLYNASAKHLLCASCNPNGSQPAGVFDPGEANTGGAGEGLGLVVDRPVIWGAGVHNADHWLAGSVPGWTPTAYAASASARALYQSRYLSDSGRLFFNSPDELVPGTGAKEKVYEYEPGGLGGCGSAGGCVNLISAANSTHEAAFLDASEGGNDVFFLSADRLIPQRDTDTNFDVYDARVCTPSSPCEIPPPPPPPECRGEIQCKGAPESTSSGLAAPASSTYSAGNRPSGGTLPSKEVVQKPKPLTRVQLLAKALKACKKKKPKKKRLACERQAHKKYGPKKKK